MSTNLNVHRASLIRVSLFVPHSQSHGWTNRYSEAFAENGKTFWIRIAYCTFKHGPPLFKGGFDIFLLSVSVYEKCRFKSCIMLFQIYLDNCVFIVQNEIAVAYFYFKDTHKKLLSMSAYQCNGKKYHFKCVYSIHHSVLFKCQRILQDIK